MKSKAFIWIKYENSLSYGNDFDKSRISRIGDDIYFCCFGGVGTNENTEDCIVGSIGFSYYQTPYNVRYISDVGVDSYRLSSFGKRALVGMIK